MSACRALSLLALASSKKGVSCLPMSAEEAYEAYEGLIQKTNREAAPRDRARSMHWILLSSHEDTMTLLAIKSSYCIHVRLKAETCWDCECGGARRLKNFPGANDKYPRSQFAAIADSAVAAKNT